VVLVVVLSDTHIRTGGARRLPDSAYTWLEQADLILHAGDIVVAEVLDELRGFAPVHAVLGNNDRGLAGLLPETEVVEIEGVRVGLIHDSGPSTARAGRMRRRFPEEEVVVFGHSHIPWDGPGLDGQLLFNPGSPTDKRMQPHHTLGTLTIEEGAVTRHAIHFL
jgi:putative phosphoesterase